MRQAIVILILLFTACTHSFGQDLIYKPKNPAFGGDTFNYQWMLSSAEAQNSLVEDTDSSTSSQSELDQFTANLNNQLLSQISRTLFVDQFGQNGLTEGTFNFGTLFVEVFPSVEGLVVNILDTSTGDQSQVIIPN
ncbi:curli assembly protein CsgF [Flavobacteriaceae bacterium (ex Bugula neritina AB1)]|nr:curli assembly protein CsgF [Flavobacteriaceae bacterium (ex Bugula neritina AB1)]